MASSGGVLVSTDYPGVDPDRPLRTLGLVGVAAQLVEDKHPRAIAGPAAKTQARSVGRPMRRIASRRVVR